MKKMIPEFIQEEQGQDLIEYTLLVALVIMSTVALMISNGGGIKGILFVTTNNLNAAHAMSAN